MSDPVKLALIAQLPAILAGAAALLAALLGFVNRQGIRDVHQQLNSALAARVDAANSEGRIQERAEQRQADKDSPAAKIIP